LNEVGLELRRAWPRVGVRHAAVTPAEPKHGGDPIRASLLHERERLATEHSPILRLLSRLVQGLDGIGNETLEDKQIFILRIRELTAILHGHETEEDRLFDLSVWQTGVASPLADRHDNRGLDRESPESDALADDGRSVRATPLHQLWWDTSGKSAAECSELRAE
jgi:hypothetical protein